MTERESYPIAGKLIKCEECREEATCECQKCGASVCESCFDMFHGVNCEAVITA